MLLTEDQRLVIAGIRLTTVTVRRCLMSVGSNRNQICESSDRVSIFRRMHDSAPKTLKWMEHQNINTRKNHNTHKYSPFLFLLHC